MRKFSDFNIKTEEKGFVGDKIRIERILNREITVHAFRVEPSKFEGKGDCLWMQIAIGETKHVLFTSGKKLIDDLGKIPAEEFPFTTTIIKEESNRLIFT